jgi:hypothetical protein
MSSTPAPTRRSSRIQTGGSTRMTLNLHHTDTDHRRNIRRTTPIIGTLPNSTRPIHNSTPITYNHVASSSQRLNRKTSKRARPRWYRPPPPEAYLIIRAHRRPIGGWGEDWSRKGDGWYVPLFPYPSHHSTSTWY